LFIKTLSGIIRRNCMQCTEDLYTNNILEPTCAYASPKQNAELDRRSLQQNPTDFMLSPPRIPEEWCRVIKYPSPNSANLFGWQFRV
jgi:hypothetical protein